MKEAGRERAYQVARRPSSTRFASALFGFVLDHAPALPRQSPAQSSCTRQPKSEMSRGSRARLDRRGPCARAQPTSPYLIAADQWQRQEKSVNTGLARATFSVLSKLAHIARSTIGSIGLRCSMYGWRRKSLGTACGSSAAVRTTALL